MRRSSVCLIVVLTTWGGVGSVRAQGGASPAPEDAPAEATGQDARALFLRGQEAYQHGDYEASVELWAEAYAIDARPALQYNLAQAYGRLGRLEEEQTALELYIASASPDDPLLAPARARIATLRERLARTALRIEGGVDGATLFVDGEERGRLPLGEPLSVGPGSHRIEATAPGYARFQASAHVPGGEIVSVAVTMRESARRAPVPTSSIILWSAGGGVLAAGGILGIVALKKADGAAPGTSAADTAHGMAIGADIAMSVGVAAAATGLVLFLVRGDVEEEDAASASRLRMGFTPLVSANGAGIGLDGRF
jgi:hypothetical protein